MDELAELRRRAYGPDADIDAAGAARLRELERRWSSAEPAPVEAIDSGPIVEAVPFSADPASTVPTAEVAHGSTHERRSRTRRIGLASRVRWLLAGVAIGVAAFGGIGAAVAAGAAPDAVLPLVDESRGGEVLWLTAADDARVHAIYQGLDVRSLVNEGGSCVYVIIDGGSQGTANCAPSGATASVSLWIGYGAVAEDGGWIDAPADSDLERGAFLRFELHGDEVRVWRHDPAPPRARA